MSKKAFQDLCVIDMATLRVAVPEGADGTVAVLTASNEVVVEFPLDSMFDALGQDGTAKPAAVVMEAFDRVLAYGRVLREDASGAVVAHAVALLNPYTNEIAVGPLPRTLTFEWAGPCPAAGLTATLDGNEMRVGSTLLEQRLMSRRDLAGIAAAHSM
jgi:hypothetical protein